MGNTINKPLDSVNNDDKLNLDVEIYDKSIKNYEDALRLSVKDFKNTNINHVIEYTEERTFTVTSFEKYENLYYYYTNQIFFDCDYITKLCVNTKKNEKIKMFIEIDKSIYDINDLSRTLTLHRYGKNIKFIFCSSTPIVESFCVSYQAFIASKNCRSQLLTGHFNYTNIEYKNGNIIHHTYLTNTKVNYICRIFFKDDPSKET